MKICMAAEAHRLDPELTVRHSMPVRQSIAEQMYF